MDHPSLPSNAKGVTELPGWGAQVGTCVPDWNRPRDGSPVRFTLQGERAGERQAGSVPPHLAWGDGAPSRAGGGAEGPFSPYSLEGGSRGGAPRLEGQGGDTSP